MKVKRGDVVLLNHPFSDGTGSKVRPVLIVQGDRDNARLTNTIVAVISRTVHRASQFDTQFLIDVATDVGKSSGLNATSAVICAQLFTVNEQLLNRKIGVLPAVAMLQVNTCLRAALDLG